ncbi:hypothetical protein D3C76_1416730 [compost metagenome]
MSTTIVANRCADAFRYAVKVSNQIFQAFFLQFRSAFQSCVKVSYVSIVMAIVVDFHRFCIDMWFQSVVSVRKCW